MRKIVVAVLIGVGLLSTSCFDPHNDYSYNNGIVIYKINDTITIPFTGSGKITWEHSFDASNNIYVGMFTMDYYQFDSTDQYHCTNKFWSHPDPESHSFHTYQPGTDGFGVGLYHPVMGGIYYANPGTTKIYFNEFNVTRINGYFYGDFLKYNDTVTVYLTCDFDFTR